MEERRIQIDKVRTIIGASLITMFSSALLYWGNLSVYLMSYLIKQGNAGSSTIQPCWFHYSNTVGYALGKMLADYLVKKRLRVKAIIAIGIIMVNSFYFLTAFCAGISWNVYVFVVVSLVGLGNGVYECLLITHYVREWSRNDDRPWLIMGLFSSSGPLGATIMNFIITWLINPKNISPDMFVGRAESLVIFSQDEIVDKVPSCILTINLLNLIAQLAGLFLLKERNVSNQFDYTALHIQNYEDMSVGSHGTFESSKISRLNEADVILTQNHKTDLETKPFGIKYNRRNEDPRKHEYVPLNDFDLAMEEFDKNSCQNTFLLSSNESSEEETRGRDTQFSDNPKTGYEYMPLRTQKQLNLGYESFGSENDNCERVSLISEHLKTEMKEIYLDQTHISIGDESSLPYYLNFPDLPKLCFVFFLLNHSKELTTSVVKVYGQTHIHNDHLLSALGSAMSLPVILSIFSCHFLLDKLGCKTCFIFLSSALPLFSLSMYFMAMWNEYAYFVSTLFTQVMVGFICPSTIVHCLVLLFETRLNNLMVYFSLASLFSAVSSCLIAEAFIPDYGWFSVFGSNAVFSAVALIIIVSTFRNA